MAYDGHSGSSYGGSYDANASGSDFSKSGNNYDSQDNGSYYDQNSNNQYYSADGHGYDSVYQQPPVANNHSQQRWWSADNVNSEPTTANSFETYTEQKPAVNASPSPLDESNELDPDWQEYNDEHGRKYYYNEKTGESRWERPAGTRKLQAILKSGLFKSAADKTRYLPFVRDMCRNCSNKAFMQKFMNGPDNYAQYINTNQIGEDADGLSPFHIACMYQTRLDVLAVLIDECGADIMHTTEDNRTALDVALGAGRVDISKFLMCRGGLTTLQLKVTRKVDKEQKDFFNDWRRRGIQELVPELRKMFKSDWEEFDAAVEETGPGSFIDVSFRALPAGHPDEFTVGAYMDDVASEHQGIKDFKLEIVKAQWNRRSRTGNALKFRFKPPWLDKITM